MIINPTKALIQTDGQKPVPPKPPPPFRMPTKEERDAAWKARLRKEKAQKTVQANGEAQPQKRNWFSTPSVLLLPAPALNVFWR